MNQEMAGCYTSAEQLPKELIDVCLNCKRLNCTGKCMVYSNAVKEYKAVVGLSKYHKNMAGIRTGYEPKRYECMGQMITVREASELYGISITTIRTWLKRGLNMEEIIDRYDKKRKNR